MDLESTQRLTKMSIRNLPGGKKRPARRADNLAAIYEPKCLKMWEPQPLATLRASTACTGKILTLPIDWAQLSRFYMKTETESSL
jgi:hypothetical protein